jgi:hypothetical protein
MEKYVRQVKLQVVQVFSVLMSIMHRQVAEFQTRVARFFFAQHTKTGGNIPDNQISQMATRYVTVCNGCKIDQMTKIYQHRPLQDPSKFAQIWIFCLKICHLATLFQTVDTTYCRPNKVARNVQLTFG